MLDVGYWNAIDCNAIASQEMRFQIWNITWSCDPLYNPLESIHRHDNGAPITSPRFKYQIIKFPLVTWLQ